MTQTQQPSNLLFLLGESHAPNLLGALGNPFIKTPNLDRLASQGTLFDSAYCASPLCVPARASIATGRFPHQTGFWESSMAFDGSTDSWMKRLRDVGYETVGIGKMHFRSDKDDNGFSRFIETMHIADGVGDLIGALRYIGEEPTYQGLWDLWTSQYGAGDTGPYRQYDERIVTNATEWLTNEAATMSTPWALSVHTIAAHAPFIVPKEFLEMYDPAMLPTPIRFSADERPHHPSIEHLRHIVCHEDGVTMEHVQKLRAAYFATISYLDHLIGRILVSLEENGLTETTRIIYTSDHGFSCGDHYIFGLFHLFEESLGVPMIMAGPDIPVGERVSRPVSHVDLYPTILESCSVPLTEQERTFGGKSLWPVLRDSASDHGPIFAEYHGCGTRSGGFVIRDGGMKLIEFVGLEPQLYDLSKDPEEARNLAGEPGWADKLAEMRRTLHSIVDPETVDQYAKNDQGALIERHGGKDTVLREKGGFSYSPPPGLDWKSMSGDKNAKTLTASALHAKGTDT